MKGTFPIGKFREKWKLHSIIMMQICFAKLFRL